MKKVTLKIPDELFNHLSTLPTFLDYDKKTIPSIKRLMKHSPAIRAEAEILYKLNELYCGYDQSAKTQAMARACSKRLNEIFNIRIVRKGKL